eukprot:760093-Hanusia_phi.AAC.6
MTDMRRPKVRQSCLLLLQPQPNGSLQRGTNFCVHSSSPHLLLRLRATGGKIRGSATHAGGRGGDAVGRADAMAGSVPSLRSRRRQEATRRPPTPPAPREACVRALPCLLTTHSRATGSCRVEAVEVVRIEGQGGEWNEDGAVKRFARLLSGSGGSSEGQPDFDSSDSENWLTGNQGHHDEVMCLRGGEQEKVRLVR